MNWQPMLGAKVERLEQISLPCFASLKLDGIRAIWQMREFFSRTLHTIPNRNLQKQFAALSLPQGLDGELISGAPNDSDVYRRTNSTVMSAGKPVAGVKFFAFDNANLSTLPFWRRYEQLVDIPPDVIRLDHSLIETYDALQDFEEAAVSLGYEGVVCRNPEGRYKYGRSTLNEQLLLKVKRFTDAEATVVAFEELQHNANPDTRDARGYIHRSSHQAGKVPGGVLGALVVDWQGSALRVGTGFTGSDRRDIWEHQDKYLGKLAKFKYLPIGVKDLPRHPVFLGWRDRIDV